MYDVCAPSRKRARTRKVALSGSSAFVRRRLAALAAGGGLLGVRAALRRVALRGRGVRLLAAVLRSVRRVRDFRRALLRHPLVLQGLVLFLVLDVCTLSGHLTPPFRRKICPW